MPPKKGAKANSSVQDPSLCRHGGPRATSHILEVRVPTWVCWICRGVLLAVVSSARVSTRDPGACSVGREKDARL